MAASYFELKDQSTLWFERVFEHHNEEALARANSLLAATRTDENGCRVTDTKTRSNTRFQGHQLPVYRFVYCVVNKVVASSEDVVRHRCHNRLCCNPEHCTLGSKAENKQDDWDHWANGVDPKFL